MKQTLEEAINEIGGVHPDWKPLECFRKGFKEGANWQEKQSPWISTDDSFPEDDDLVLCSSQIYGKVVLRWNKLSQEWLYPEENHIYCDWDKVDCWMYIPEL